MKLAVGGDRLEEFAVGDCVSDQLFVRQSRLLAGAEHHQADALVEEELEVLVPRHLDGQLAAIELQIRNPAQIGQLRFGRITQKASPAAACVRRQSAVSARAACWAATW